jgi:hypothetical protein
VNDGSASVRRINSGFATRKANNSRPKISAAQGVQGVGGVRAPGRQGTSRWSQWSQWCQSWWRPLTAKRHTQRTATHRNATICACAEPSPSPSIALRRRPPDQSRKENSHPCQPSQLSQPSPTLPCDAMQCRPGPQAPLLLAARCPLLFYSILPSYHFSYMLYIAPVRPRAPIYAEKS